MHRLGVFLIAAIAVVSAPLTTVAAAPQALGLVATNGAVPLNCFAGECAAEFSAFCLQQARGIPSEGTPYRAVGEDFTLVAIAADGKVSRLPGGAHLAITAERGFTAVKISLPKRALAALGAVRAAVEVGPKVSLIPVAVAGDSDPQSEAEIAAASGALRAVGDAIVDRAGAEAGAVRLTNRMVNALPARGRVPVEESERLWQSVAQGAPDDETLARGSAIVANCRGLVDTGYAFSLRRCLENAHDGQVERLNIRYWNAVVGS